MRNPAVCKCENKGADQLCNNCTADQRLYFRYTASTIPSTISIQELYSLVCIRPSLKSQRPVFSRCGSYNDMPGNVLVDGAACP